MNWKSTLVCTRFGQFAVFAVLLASSSVASALSFEREVTAAYIKAHPHDLTVKVTQGKNGLLSFTVSRNLEMRKYLVARVSVSHAGRIVAEMHSPSYGKRGENTFYFSILREDIADSTFSLGESGLTGQTMTWCHFPAPFTFASS